MAVARSAKVLLGTDETTGVTITNGSTSTEAEVDMLGDDLSMGYANFYLKYTGTGTVASSLVAKIIPRRITGQSYLDQLPAANIKTYTPISGTEKIFLGTFIIGRFASVTVRNTSGASMTNVFVAAEVLKMT